MSDASETPSYHADPNRLAAALRLAESVTGFSARLIEKDYYCSVVLHDLAELFRGGLVFKGGTSLSKVHTEFFRLSEDLDFGVSISQHASRRIRRDAAAPFKTYFSSLPARLECFRIVEPLLGHNDSRQYNGRLAYRSVVTGEHEFLKIEVGLREEVLLPTPFIPAQTLLKDPNTGAPAVRPFDVRVLMIQEAYAEKVRAALTRREPAIRDYFDLDNAVQKRLLHHLNAEFLGLVAQKLAVTADPVDTSPARLESLRAQIEPQLKPVLRVADFDAFLLDRAVAMLEEVSILCRKK